MPGFVGSVQNHSTASPLVLNYNTAGGGTTAGNCLVACITAFATSPGAVITGVTLGGITDNWADTGAGASKSAIWIDPDCSGGLSAVSISATTTGGSFMLNAFVMEFSGVAQVSPLDRHSNSGTLGSFTSGATPTTTTPSQVWVGIGMGDSTATFTIAGPAPPWSNLAAISNASGTEFTRSVAGWQAVSATGAATYSGTFSPSASQDGVAAVITLKAAAAGPGGLFLGQAVKRAANW